MGIIWGAFWYVCAPEFAAFINIGVLKVAHKFCGPVFKSGYALLVIQPWHLVAFELKFCMSFFFICGCVQFFYQTLTLDELAALSATGFVDLLVIYYYCTNSNCVFEPLFCV